LKNNQRVILVTKHFIDYETSPEGGRGVYKIENADLSNEITV